MLTGWSAITAILVMAVVTFALRALPFVAAGLLSRHGVGLARHVARQCREAGVARNGITALRQGHGTV